MDISVCPDSLLPVLNAAVRMLQNNKTIAAVVDVFFRQMDLKLSKLCVDVYVI